MSLVLASVMLTATAAAKVSAKPARTGTAASVVLKRGTTARPVRGGGALLRWRTRNERANVGFDVYLVRRMGQTGPKAARRQVRLTTYPVAGPVLAVSPATIVRRTTSYRWFARAARRGDLLYIRDISLSGRTRLHGPFKVAGTAVLRVRSSRTLRTRPRAPVKRPAVPAGLGRPIPAGPPSAVIPPGTPPAVVQALLAARQTARVGVAADGWARVRLADLANRGVDVSFPGNLHLFTGGREVAALVRDDALEFYGEAVDTIDTGTRAYVVDAETGPGRRVTTAPTPGSAVAGPASFTATAAREDRRLYVSSLRNGEGSNFVGAVVGSAGTNQAIALPGLTGGGAPSLTVTLQGVTTGHHAVAISVNGSAVGTVSFDGQTPDSQDFDVSTWQPGANTVRLVSSGPGDVAAVVRLVAHYPRTLNADGDALLLTAPGDRRVSLGGFVSGGVRAMDVTDPATPIVLDLDPAGDGGTITTLSGAARRVLAFAPDAVVPASELAAGSPSTLRDAAHDGELTIITTPGFEPALAPLVARRRAEGLSVAVVAVQDIYDEFAQGQTDHHAITAFLEYARSAWRTPPRFVLLGGDGTFDPRGYIGHGTAGDIVPIQPFDTSTGESASDSRLAATLATGRLPARTSAQLQLMVAKTLAFTDTPPERRAALVSDISDTADFRSSSVALEPLVPPSWSTDQVDRGSDPDARGRLLGDLNAGPALVNYLGHGSVDFWRGNLLTAADAAKLTNTTRPSLYVLMTCLNGYFTDPTLTSLAEGLLYSAGGAAAVFSSTGITQPGGQDEANRQLLTSLYGSGGTVRLGDAITASLSATTDQDVRNTWTLLGDPTLPVGS